MSTTTRGRRDPSLLTKEGPPAASTSVADLEAQRQAQLAAVAAVEAKMAASTATTDPDAVEVDLATGEVTGEEPVETTPQERYEALLAAMPDDEPRWVVGARAKRLQVEGHTLSRGDVVPGAHAWPRRDSWVSAGYIERA